jgi:hypothetical protein
MNENPTIITERVDDIPLLLAHMQRMGLPALFDHHFPRMVKKLKRSIFHSLMTHPTHPFSP